MCNLNKIISRFEKLYPNVKCHLDYSYNFELLVAVILSAQCTDKRVNKVTKKLFLECESIEKFAQIKCSKLEQLIYSTGFYKNKAKNIISSANFIINNFNGKVPSKMSDLIKLDWVGRKTANIVSQELFMNVQGVIVDTHVLRLSYRLWLSSQNKNAETTEKELIKLLDKKNWYQYSHWCIMHGRNVCKSRNPDCNNCIFFEICNKKFWIS